MSNIKTTTFVMQKKYSMANFVFKVRREKIQKFRNCNNAIYRVQIRLNQYNYFIE